MGLQQLRNIRCVFEQTTLCVLSVSCIIHTTRSSTLIIFYRSATESTVA